MGKTPDDWSYGDLDAGFKNAALVLDETFVTPDVSHQDFRAPQCDGLLAGTASYIFTRERRAPRRLVRRSRDGLNMDAEKTSFSLVNIREADSAAKLQAESPRIICGTVVEEGKRAGDDADQPRRGDVYRARAAGLSGPDEGRVFQRRADPCFG